MSVQEDTLEQVNQDLKDYDMSKNQERFVKKQQVLLNRRPADNEYTAFDMVLSREGGVYYLNIHDGERFVRFVAS